MNRYRRFGVGLDQYLTQRYLFCLFIGVLGRRDYYGHFAPTALGNIKFDTGRHEIRVNNE